LTVKRRASSAEKGGSTPTLGLVARKVDQFRSAGSRIVAAERRQKAMGLRRNGATYEMIAEALDITLPMARRYVKQGIDAIHKDIAETAEEARTLELERLDTMLRVLANKVEAAAAEGDYRPMQMQLRVQERRSRLLGLDSPQRHDHSGQVTVEHGIERQEIDDLERLWQESGIDSTAEEITDAEVLLDRPADDKQG
jgi:predicted transcriptional regulator